MENAMTRRTAALLLTIAAMVMGANRPASAGLKRATPVVVTMNSTGTVTTAWGTLGDARSSADTSQYIGCKVSISAGGTSKALCYAQNAAGAVASCTSTDANVVATALSVSSTSSIRFAYPTATAICSSLSVDNGSTTQPSAP